jgi:hypothetical protein
LPSLGIISDGTYVLLVFGELLPLLADHLRNFDDVEV